MSRPKVPFIRIAVMLAALGLFVGVFALVGSKLKAPEDYVELSNYKPWSDEVVDAAALIPVQDGGRVKPFSTQAGYLMLGMRGERSMKIRSDGAKVTIDPTRWLLDVMFRPQFAVQQPTFRIDNTEVLESVELSVRSKKRDRFSYAELEPVIGKLMERAQRFEQLEQQDKKSLDPVEKQTLALARNLRLYEAMLGYLSFARNGVTMPPLPGSAPDATAQRVPVSVLMGTAPVIRKALDDAQANGQSAPPHVAALLQQIVDFSNLSKYVIFVLPPPEDAKDKIWFTAGNQIWDVMIGQSADPRTAIGDIQALETLVAAQQQSQPAFAAELQKFNKRVSARADALGQYRAIGAELSYFRMHYFAIAMALCIIAFVLIWLVWLAPESKGGRGLAKLCLGLVVVATLAIIAGTVHRSYIMARPPVGNLYDTIPFITAAALLVLLIVEVLTKRRFALGVATFVGMMGLFLAWRYEASEAIDTMNPLPAVLDSNFWLATHVTTISLGYSAGLVSAFIAHVYIFMRALGLGDREMRRTLTRAVYGCVCLTLFLSLVGTVLGGVWANDSWGRFWGWDPKENGALMIVLLNIAILHARLGGYIKEWGLHLAAVFGAIVITFSWWHVNFLGVGLHNYGFTEGKGILELAYMFEAAVLLIGGIAWCVEYYNHHARKADKQPQVPAETL